MRTKNHVTTFATIDPLSGTGSLLQPALGSASSSSKRGVISRHFSGARACAIDTNTATSVVKLYHVTSTGSHLMDSVSLLPSESAIWTEDDYGIILDAAEYMKFVVSGDDANLWLNTYDGYI